MSDVYVLFKAEMIREVRSGQKRQTRRIVTHRNSTGRGYKFSAGDWNSLRWDSARMDLRGFFCAGLLVDVKVLPRVKIGDRIIARETWATEEQHDALKPKLVPRTARLHYLADGDKPEWCGKTRPAIFLPYWASRYKMPVVDVRAQFVQDISEEDAKAEGADCSPFDKAQGSLAGWSAIIKGGVGESSFKLGFKNLWDSINEKKAPWSDNPPVWAYTFGDPE